MAHKAGPKAKSSRGKKGNKKHGRNKIKCAKYRAQGRREKNKARKAAKRQRKLDLWETIRGNKVQKQAG